MFPIVRMPIMIRHPPFNRERKPLLPAAYRARWLFPVDAPPIADGILEIDAAGRIAAISETSNREAIDLGHVAMVPGLVNAHAHLEFSDLAAPVAPARPFPEWIKKVVAIRRSRTAPIEDIIGRGISDVRRGGTTAVGEIATYAVENYPHRADSVQLCLFQEIIGPRSENWPNLLAMAETHFTQCTDISNIIGGLSPHAPYTVPQELFEQIVALAARHCAPAAVHLAESESERSLLSAGRGELVEMMRGLGLWDESLHPPGRSFSDWIGLLTSCPRGLIIHGNYLNDEELGLLAGQENLTLVYCPRTHAYFAHPPHPFRRLLDRGGRVALGTDGRSSNPDLSLWAEATFVARRNPGLPSDTILGMITRSSAEALGIADRAGTLAVGRDANFLVADVEEIARRPVLFRSGREPSRVFHRGVELSRQELDGA